MPRDIQPLTDDDPRQAGPYLLTGRIGSGGMGRVYLATGPDGGQVAVKVVRPDFADDTEFRVRFRHEVAAARRVHGLPVTDRHPAGRDRGHQPRRPGHRHHRRAAG